jgi:hypothetical protein
MAILMKGVYPNANNTALGKTAGGSECTTDEMELFFRHVGGSETRADRSLGIVRYLVRVNIVKTWMLHLLPEI